VPAVAAALLVGAASPAAAQLNNRRAARPEVRLPGGPVRHVILRSCTTCHGIDDYAYHALDRAGWRQLVGTMQEKGAVIPEDDLPVLLDWLIAEFGADSTPFPRDYVVVPVDDEVFADAAAARGYLNATCSVCHSLDRIETARFEKRRWRATVANMRAKGAAVADENVDALVDYLARTRGAE
jgi:cytochrome c5